MIVVYTAGLLWMWCDVVSILFISLYCYNMFKYVYVDDGILWAVVVICNVCVSECWYM